MKHGSFGSPLTLCAGLVTLALATACSEMGPTSTMDEPALAGALAETTFDVQIGLTGASAEGELFEVCKRWEGTAATANFTVDGGGGAIAFDDSGFLGPFSDGGAAGGHNDWMCADVWLDGGPTTVTVDETGVSGGANPYSTTVVAVGFGNANPQVNGTSVSGNIQGASGASGIVAFYTNTELLPMLDGRMTGGGSIFDGNDQSGPRFTHGFELHCDPDDHRQNLEINWEGNRFHLTDLTDGRCIDDPAIDPLPRRTGIDTFFGMGVGRLNGVDGATIDFVFTDQGEPGRQDTAVFTIVGAGGAPVIGPISGHLIRGNHQAHTNN